VARVVSEPGHPRRGEIYWVDFGPTRGSEQAKRRPALVMQNDVGNRFSATTIVAAITSRIPSREYPFQVPLPAPVLGRPATVLCEQLLTVDISRLDPSPAGVLGPELLARVDSALARSLGLPG